LLCDELAAKATGLLTHEFRQIIQQRMHRQASPTRLPLLGLAAIVAVPLLALAAIGDRHGR